MILRWSVGQTKGASVIERLTESNQWKFFGVLPRAARSLAIAWWFVLLLRGVLPALFAIVSFCKLNGVKLCTLFGVSPRQQSRDGSGVDFE